MDADGRAEVGSVVLNAFARGLADLPKAVGQDAPIHDFNTGNVHRMRAKRPN